jgi:TatD DNase family protein
MFIDTHCHLNFKEFDADRAMVIGNAKKAGVKKFICPGADLFSSKQAVLLAQKNPGIVYAAVGYHPYEAQNTPAVDQLPTENIVAIGEIGLDYHQYKGEEAAGKKQNQKILFEEQLRLALTHHLPAIMHVRDAFEDFFAIYDSVPVKGVIHCFSGGLQEVRLARERGLFIGLDGNITYSKQLQAIIPDIPLSMILLETDAPYLTPVPHRGERNEPKYIPVIAEEIARLQNVDIDQVKNQTTTNAQSLFHI